MEGWGEVLIVGGGPSAKKFDFYKSLPCERILAINEAIFLLPLPLLGNKDAAPIVFSIDASWVNRRRDFLASYNGEKYLALLLETFPECGGIPGVNYLKLGHGFGLSDDPGVLNGTNSGHSAINLAYHKGISKIYLIGFDMDPDEYGEYKYWKEELRTAVPQLQAKNIEVLNLNPFSHIEAFPKIKEVKNGSDV